jgi:N-acetylneuraminic acid mutarotase
MRYSVLFATLLGVMTVYGCSAATQDLGSSDPNKADAGAVTPPPDTETEDASGPDGHSAPASAKDGGKDVAKPPPTKPPPTWLSYAKMPTGRTRLAAVFGKDGLLYAIGGYTSVGATGVVEVYDPTQDSWSTAPAMPTPRYGLTAVLANDGRIFVMGGDYDDNAGTDGVSSKVEVFDPVTSKWSSGPSLPEGRYLGAAAVRQDGTILFAGGYNRNANTTRASVYALAPGATSWTTTSPMTSTRTGHAMVTGPDGSIYAIGGHDHLSQDLASAERRGPSAQGFSTLPDMSTARDGVAASIGDDGRIYVVGGGVTSTVAYDPTSNQWDNIYSPTPDMALYAAMAKDPNGMIYRVGGELDQPLKDVFALSY